MSEGLQAADEILAVEEAELRVRRDGLKAQRDAIRAEIEPIARRLHDVLAARAEIARRLREGEPRNMQAIDATIQSATAQAAGGANAPQ